MMTFLFSFVGYIAIICGVLCYLFKRSRKMFDEFNKLVNSLTETAKRLKQLCIEWHKLFHKREQSIIKNVYKKTTPIILVDSWSGFFVHFKFYLLSHRGSSPIEIKILEGVGITSTHAFSLYPYNSTNSIKIQKHNRTKQQYIRLILTLRKILVHICP